MQDARIRQILLITDGGSNEGTSPVKAASVAYQHGVGVNVVGIVEENGRKKHLLEIEQVARAGGGLYEIVHLEALSRTIQMMTRQAVTRTIHNVVKEELQQLMGSVSLEDIAPHTRMKIVEKAEQIGENSTLELVLLIDTSASMIAKLNAVARSVQDLSVSLQSRKGTSKVAVATYPGNGFPLDLKADWTDDISKLSLLSRQLHASGNTPTGPALLAALKFFSGMEVQKTTGFVKDYVI